MNYSMSPDLFQMMAMMRMMRPQPIEVKIDLSAIRDLMGKKGFIDGEDDEPARRETPVPVNVMNTLIPRPG